MEGVGDLTMVKRAENWRDASVVDAKAYSRMLCEDDALRIVSKILGCCECGNRSNATCGQGDRLVQVAMTTGTASLGRGAMDRHKDFRKC